MRGTPDDESTDRYPPSDHPDELYAYTDLRDHTRDDDESDDGDGETVVTPRPRRARRRPADDRPAARPAAKPKHSRKRGAEISIGALLGMIALAIGAYMLLVEVLHWHRDVGLVSAGVVAGFLLWAVIGPTVQAARAAVARWIGPNRTTGVRS